MLEASNKKWIPLEETLASQIEDGYLKHQPWQHFVEVQDAAGEEKNKAALSQSDRFQWSLFGPYRDHYTVYTGIHEV